MTNFTLALAPPASSLEYDNEIPVFFQNMNHAIGICTIVHDEQGMRGVFSLQSPVQNSDYVYYMFDLRGEIPHMYGILIDSIGRRANTIGNSQIA